MSEEPANKTAGPKPAVPWGVLLAIAIVIIVVYVIAVFVLFQTADDEGTSDVIWGRYTFLLAGFEAIVFTAVGWLFGREVNRKQAEQAEKATEEAKEKTAEAAEFKAKGEGLRQAILSAPAPAGTPRGFEVPGDPFAAVREQARNTTF
ncbi:hypothetical protein [Microbacterium sp. NPDC056569]|uniref:hypothetical protein n=1 Tax=Microbacterium sp. NPDC056569 TaxID=3345867 RepID=UPI0036716AAA